MDDSLPPIRLRHVDQRIDVNMSITGVSEDHAAHFALGQRRFDPFDVVRKFRERYRAVLDELHRRGVLETGEYGARRVTKLPDLPLCVRSQRDLDVRRSRLTELFR